MKWIFPLFVSTLLVSTTCATEIKIGPSTIEVEMADTESKRAQGLSGRRELSDKHGMLFTFDTPQICSFWMKGIKIALSIGFFNQNRELLQWIDMLPPKNSSELLPTYKSPKETKYALEVPMGWFRKQKIKIGQTFEWVVEGNETDELIK
jgi:uncharacterized membrane protein (UPF0127 family)